MAYTVKQLAELSGVSVRTLHWYDEKGLLKPAYQGENGYRYYEKEQLLTLQQILFFKELGFPLSDIQKMLEREDFDKAEALKKHRHLLENDLARKKKLLATIDKTILFLEGKETMKLETIFKGFSEEKQKFYEDYLLESGVEEKILEKSRQKMKSLSKEEWLAHKAEADRIHDDLIVEIEKGSPPEAASVQKIIHRHYDLTCKFWTPDQESFISLGEMYGAHPDFVEFYNTLHPELLKFLQKAMKVYAQKSL